MQDQINHDNLPEMTEELLSIQSLIPAVETTHPARCVMFGSQFSQRPVISGSEPCVVLTGVEEEFGKFTFKVKMPEDGTIIKIIPRYEVNPLDDPEATMDQPAAEVVVIYRSTETGQYGIFQIPYFCSHHPEFGFKYETKPAYDHLAVGMSFAKDTVFADTPAVKGDSHYTYSKNLNICYMSHRSVGLDGYVISEAALPFFKFKIYERRSVEFGSNSFLLNTYGTKKKYKAYPDIGEYVREDGLLVVSRRIDPLEFPTNCSINDVMEMDALFDRPTYTRPGKGKVVDIIAVQSTSSNRILSQPMIEQTERYVKKNLRFYQEILDFYTKVQHQWRKANHGQDINPEIFTPELSSYIVTAMAVTNQKTHYQQPLTLNYKSRPIDTWRLDFIIEYELTPTRGSKFTCQAGGKGVVCMIEKEENMPIDSDGNRAHILSSPDSIPGRMNLPRLYIPYFAAVARDVRRRMLEELGIDRHFSGKMTIEELYAIPDNKINTAVKTMLLYYSIVSKRSYDEFTQNLNNEERYEWLLFIINDRLYTYLPVQTEDSYDDIVVKLDKTFTTTYGPVSYIGADGKRHTTKNKFRISEIPIMLLDKIADNFLSVDIGKISNFGTLTAMNELDKNTRPWPKKSTRVFGETDSRLYSNYGGPEFIAELIDRSGNIASQYEISNQLLSAENPVNIERIIDREKIPLGNTRPLQITSSLLKCMGISIVYEEEELDCDFSPIPVYDEEPQDDEVEADDE